MNRDTLKPMLKIEDDDIAIINCGLCGDMTDGVPLCSACWSSPLQFKDADAIMAAMPATWPSGDRWREAWSVRAKAGEK